MPHRLNSSHGRVHTARELSVTEPTHLSPSLARVFPLHSGLSEAGELTIGGCSVPELADRYGTPTYVFDEAGMRETMRSYRDGLAQRWPDSRVCFASKSLPCAAAYAVAQSEGLSVDVAGEGELRLALASGVTPENLVLHGNAKSSSEVELAVSSGLGLIVVDNESDIELIARFATQERPQSVLIRIIPEIDARTHPSIATGGRASKFGLPIGRVRELVAELTDHPSIRVRGVHLHLGSQIMELEPFAEAARVLASVGEFEIYNLGGGLGVNYSDDDEAPDLERYLDRIAEAASQALPTGARIMLEPGRSLVARSGVTVYRVRNVKQTYRTFVAVDGGMADQMNIALTDTRFTPVIADRAAASPDTTAQLVGRQCESGDLLVDEAQLHAPRSGDTIALAGTGAYGYTLINNYNGALHPPIVFCSDGNSRLVAPRQTFDEYLAPHRAEIDRLNRARAPQPSPTDPGVRADTERKMQ